MSSNPYLFDDEPSAEEAAPAVEPMRSAQPAAPAGGGFSAPPQSLGGSGFSAPPQQFAAAPAQVAAPPQYPSPQFSAQPHYAPARSFGDLPPSVPPPTATDLDRIRDVEVELTLEIGRRRMRIGEVLRLSAGATLELGKSIGEPLEVFVNGQLLGRGEAVVVGDRYGLRITELVTKEGR